MSDGSIFANGTLCDTNLYFNPCGLDGTSGCTHDDSSYGPTWSANFNDGCPHDDPGFMGGLGPDEKDPSIEYGQTNSCPASVGFAEPLQVNIGAANSGENYMWMLVR